ncbi:MAG: fibronectin type III domain-containing protein [Ginsengibacter sp.]
MCTDSHAFYEYLPKGYSPASSQKYPLLIFSHGTGENGDGSPAQLPRVLVHGTPQQISQGVFPDSFVVNGQTFRYIVISPQYTTVPVESDMQQIINYAVAHYNVDINRIYLTGLSQGGGIVFRYCGYSLAYAKRIAAIVTAAEASTPTTSRANNIAAANIAVWATHNNGDPTVPVSNTINFVNMINAAPTPPNPLAKMTIFQSNTHDAWTQTYNLNFKQNNLTVYEWLLTNSRSTSTTCNSPVGLTTSSITTSSANISWSSATGANSYDVEYKATSSSTWISRVSGTNATTANLTGLAASTSYDWRVRSNCSSGSSSFSSTQFTTIATSVCNSPTGLITSSITSASANISWASATGANSYDVEYKTTGSSTWISRVTGTTSTTANLTGLAASTSYDWRVRSNCSSGSSSFSSTQFTTLATSACNAPGGLTTSSITSGSANISWSSATGANSYDVDYKATSSSTWISRVSGTTSTTANLTGLAASTSYDWRVRSNCTSGSSSFSSTQFTTASVTGCADPSGLTASSITATSANVSWSTVGGAIDYNLFYKATSVNNWSLGAKNIVGSSFSLSGLTASTNYTWRVKANCASGSSNYILAQFTTTTAGTCNAPTGLASSAITLTGANVSWSSVSGANNYSVDYKLTTSSTWISLAAATTSTSVNLSGLASSASYDWRVRANCSSGSSSYNQAQFTTLAAGGCSDQFEPNNTYATAANVSTGVNINAQISSSGDEDYYRFSNSPGQSKIKVTLTNLPADYDLQLYTKTGFVTRTSQNTGTKDEAVILNTINSGSYVVRVYSTAGASNSSQCYTLNIQIGSGNFTIVHPASPVSAVIDATAATLEGGLEVYPVPASSSLTASFNAYKRGIADLIIINRLGQQVMRKTVGVNDGINTTKLDVSKLTPGMYFLKVINGEKVQMKKVMIGK